MFDRFLKDPHALERHQKGPFAEERHRYLTHCIRQQMAWETLRGTASYLLVIAQELRLAERPGELITHKEIEAAADRWVHRPRPRMKDLRIHSFTGHAVRWLTFLGRLERPAAVQPHADYVTQFAEYQLRERGLTRQTVKHTSWVLNWLLAELTEDKKRLKTVTIAQVDDLLAKKIRKGRYARATIQGWASNLRMFFRFAEERGWCRKGLAAAIIGPKVYAQEKIPAGPSWDEVKRLLATTEGDRPTDIRDRAMLLLLVVYGLRAGEVTKLRLQDFDWERELLKVPSGKRQRPRTYPLCRPVGDAVLRYLSEVRPRTSLREVFLTRVAPFCPLAAEGLGEVVRRRLKSLGLKFFGHTGSHVLRHACATHLLAQGLSLKEIGDHLGHHSPEATRIYPIVWDTGSTTGFVQRFRELRIHPDDVHLGWNTLIGSLSGDIDEFGLLGRLVFNPSPTTGTPPAPRSGSPGPCGRRASPG